MKALPKLTAELAVSTQEETKVDTAAAGGERTALKIIALWSETQARLAATYRQPHAYSTEAHTHNHLILKETLKIAETSIDCLKREINPGFRSSARMLLRALLDI